MKNTTRREFLKSVALVAAAASGGSSARGASAPNRSARLGYTLYGMKTVPVHEALTHCARIGYRNVELPLLSGYPTQPDKLTPALRREIRRQSEGLGLTISALTYNMSLTTPDASQARYRDGIKLVSEIARDLAPDRPPPIQTSIGGKAEEWESLREAMAGRLRAWVEAAGAAGGSLVITPHVGHAVNSPERLLWLYRQAEHPVLGLTFDRSHFELEGYSLAQSVPPLAPHTKFVHLKDTQGTPAAYNSFLPGEVYPDYPQYLRMLADGGYRGPLVVEVSGRISGKPGYDPVAVAEKCYTAVAEALEKSERQRD
jgi:sugar phosphate isomerase/epimerase